MTNLDADTIANEMVYVPKEMPEILYRKEILDGQEISLIFDAIKQEMYHLKGHSNLVWNLLDGKRTVNMVVKQVAEITGETDETIVFKDVIQCVVKIGRLGLIKFAYKLKNQEIENVES